MSLPYLSALLNHSKLLRALYEVCKCIYRVIQISSPNSLRNWAALGCRVNDRECGNFEQLSWACAVSILWKTEQTTGRLWSWIAFAEDCEEVKFLISSTLPFHICLHGLQKPSFVIFAFWIDWFYSCLHRATTKCWWGVESIIKAFSNFVKPPRKWCKWWNIIVDSLNRIDL